LVVVCLFAFVVVVVLVDDSNVIVPIIIIIITIISPNFIVTAAIFRIHTLINIEPLTLS